MKHIITISLLLITIGCEKKVDPIVGTWILAPIVENNLPHKLTIVNMMEKSNTIIFNDDSTFKSNFRKDSELGEWFVTNEGYELKSKMKTLKLLLKDGKLFEKDENKFYIKKDEWDSLTKKLITRFKKE